jgi:hypothetical protein
VTSGEHGGEDAVYDVLLPDDALAHLREQGGPCRGQPL